VRAIILAAGVGRRLDAYLGGAPKCLLAVGDEPLLGRLLRALGAAGVASAVVVIGHAAERVRAAIGDAWAGVRVRYIVNPAYTRGAILSLWAARAEFHDDLLIMDADVLCPLGFVERLVRSRHANCFLLDGSVTPSGEEQMLMARGGRVYDIAKTRDVDPRYDTCGESVGFFKVARADAGRLRQVLEAAVAAGREEIEHEQVFPEFMRDRAVGYERVDGEPWIEIDFPEDVERARRETLPRLRALEA
jgi:choline kinase